MDVQKFLEFAESKPAKEKYDPSDARTCALAQFGYPNINSYSLGEVPRHIYQAAVHHYGSNTFGALAERLRTAIKELQP